MGHRWLLAFHLISLFIWIGGLLNLSRFLGYHVGESESTQVRLSRIEKRMYFFVTLPGGILSMITGLMLLHGVGSASDASPREFLSWYLSPWTDAGTRSFWYVTFHVKLTLVGVLWLLDIYLGRQILLLSRGESPRSGVPFGALMAIVLFMAGFLVTWFVGIGGEAPTEPLGKAARHLGYAVGGGLGLAGLIGGTILGGKPGRARFSALHGLIAVIVMLIVILVLAKPVASL